MSKPMQIHPSVTVYDEAVVFRGGSVIIKANSVIGGYGFGFERDALFKMKRKEHKHKVIIGENVEIGSCTCIDRGQERDTVVGEGTKIDNLVHVAHDVVIGKHVGLVAGTSLGGSCEVGDYTFIGINVSVKPQVRIGKRCLVGMGSVVLEDVPDDVVVVGNPARILRKNTYFERRVDL